MLWFDFVAIVVGPVIFLDHMRLVGISVFTAALLLSWLIRMVLISVLRIQLILLLTIVVGTCIVDATRTLVHGVWAREATSDAKIRWEEVPSMATRRVSIIQEERQDHVKPGSLAPKDVRS